MTTAEELSCQELVELVTEYLEDAMGPGDRELFEGHIDGCAKCGRYLAQMRETVRLVGRLEPSSISPAAEQALREAFRSWRPS